MGRIGHELIEISRGMLLIAFSRKTGSSRAALQPPAPIDAAADGGSWRRREWAIGLGRTGGPRCDVIGVWIPRLERFGRVLHAIIKEFVARRIVKEHAL
jgi:hypothetical protein